MKDIIYDHFYLYSEIEEFLFEAAQEYPDFIRIQIIAVTPEGRNVYLASVTDFSYDGENKGAYYVQANVHAKETSGTTTSLYLIKTLLTDKNARELLKKVVFYIVPRVNVDAAEHALTYNDSNIRSRYKWKKDVPNALIPSDIDGDGQILTMRIDDEFGNMKILEGTELLVPREPGDREGPFYSVYPEGIIENYDGGPINRGYRMLDFNRSMPYSWEPASNSVDYPGAEPELMGVMNFVTQHCNIFAGVDLHNGTAAILRLSSKSDSEINNDDLKLIKKIGGIGSKITGFPLMQSGTEYRAAGSPPYKMPGDSNSWMYHVMGISHYVIEEGWGYTSMGMTAEEFFSDANNFYNKKGKLVEYHEKNGNKAFEPWREFDHPQLDKVEIGGEIAAKSVLMGPWETKEVSPRVTSFIIRHAQMTPELALGNIKTTALGSEIYRIRGECMNIGELGTTVMRGSSGVLARHDVYINITSSSNGFEILSTPGVKIVKELAALEKVKFEWFVRAKSGCTLNISARHPKSKTAIAEIKLC